jgi:acyl-coenzyme A synthetase/AMP-(fatty) acid ligase
VDTELEIGEIENVLEECPLVNGSVVIAKPEDESNLRLISYYVPDNKVIKVKNRTCMKSRLQPGIHYITQNTYNKSR